MTIHVLIHRQKLHEPAAGVLRAWVIQEGKRGTKNILAGCGLIDIEHAKARIKERLWTELKHVGDLEILWTVE